MPLRTKFFIKRVLDITISLLLIVLLSPVLLIIIFLIKIDSTGSVFYKATRIGKREKPFKMWKFRTMLVGADKMGPGLTGHADSRITRVGRILRRLSLDELPQLFNVFTGEMSIVGPRPEIPEIVETYSTGQRQALSVNPGITGLSQINGRDDLPVDRKIDFDLLYIKNYSLSLDLKILVKTVPVIINGRGNRF